MSDKPDYVTVTKSMRGWFALVMTWDRQLEAYVPGPSDSVTYQDPNAVKRWAKRWAAGKALEYREPLPRYLGNVPMIHPGVDLSGRIV